MRVAEILALSSAIFIGGTLLGLMLARLRAGCTSDRTLEDEFRGWVLCERALCEELPVSDRGAILRRVRTRVPPRLRLQHEDAVSEAESRRLAAV